MDHRTHHSSSSNHRQRRQLDIFNDDYPPPPTPTTTTGNGIHHLGNGVPSRINGDASYYYYNRSSGSRSLNHPADPPPPPPGTQKRSKKPHVNGGHENGLYNVSMQRQALNHVQHSHGRAAAAAEKANRKNQKSKHDSNGGGAVAASSASATDLSSLNNIGDESVSPDLVVVSDANKQQHHQTFSEDSVEESAKKPRTKKSRHKREPNYFESSHDGGQGTLKRHPKGAQIHFHYSQPAPAPAPPTTHHYFYQPQSQLLQRQPYYQQPLKANMANNGGTNGPSSVADLSQGSCDNTPATPDSLDSLVGSGCDEGDEEAESRVSMASSIIQSPSSDSNGVDLLLPSLRDECQQSLLLSSPPSASPFPTEAPYSSNGNLSVQLSQRDNLIEEVTTPVPTSQQQMIMTFPESSTTDRSTSSTPSERSSSSTVPSSSARSSCTAPATVISAVAAAAGRQAAAASAASQTAKQPVLPASSSSCLSSSPSNVTLTLCAPSSSTTPICNTPKYMPSSCSSSQSLLDQDKHPSLIDVDDVTPNDNVLKPEPVSRPLKSEKRPPTQKAYYEESPKQPFRGLLIATDGCGGASSVIEASQPPPDDWSRMYAGYPPKSETRTPKQHRREMQPPPPPPQQQQPIYVYHQPYRTQPPSPALQPRQTYASLSRIHSRPAPGNVMLVSCDSSGNLYRVDSAQGLRTSCSNPQLQSFTRIPQDCITKVLFYSCRIYSKRSTSTTLHQTTQLGTHWNSNCFWRQSSRLFF